MTAKVMSLLRSQVLALPEPERAELARELIMSLDERRGESVGEAWNDEIVRRISLVKDGDAKLLSREEFRQKMRERLGL